MTLTPTPAYALVAVRDGNGAMVRSLPSFDSASIKSLINGTEVELLPEIEEAEGATWVKVRLKDGTEGWMVQSLLATATPGPG